jgi:hypothetical protein
MPSNEVLQKVTINLFRDDYEKLSILYHNVGLAKAIRMILRRHVTAAQSRIDAQAPEQEDITITEEEILDERPGPDPGPREPANGALTTKPQRLVRERSDPADSGGREQNHQRDAEGKGKVGKRGSGRKDPRSKGKDQRRDKGNPGAGTEEGS